MLLDLIALAHVCMMAANSRWKGVSVFANLEPQWNESMGCYTLNFYDRVKLASKKNYQLIRPGDPSTIFFQFGKVPQTRECCSRHPVTQPRLHRLRKGCLRWISARHFRRSRHFSRRFHHLTMECSLRRKSLYVIIVWSNQSQAVTAT